MAQWASTRPDIFPQKLISKLVRLQDDVQVHHSFATVEKTMQEAFGTDWRNKIDIDPNPLGTGIISAV
jgi:predicted unusual protein kinase regulating ubiquinone biosynthesis (AarF/ABC1/UbiB family)